MWIIEEQLFKTIDKKEITGFLRIPAGKLYLERQQMTNAINKSWKSNAQGSVAPYAAHLGLVCLTC